MANSNALLLATQTFEAVNLIGYPEAQIILAHCAVYLATSVKSNASYAALKAAQQSIRKAGNLPVPLHLRNAPTKLMKNLNYGKNYQYAHNFSDNFIEQEYLPEAIANQTFYEPQNNARENEIKKFLHTRWKGKYGY